MTREITIDDIIEFIIKHCDDTKLMDKINKTSFPFTTKYLSKNKRESGATLTPTYPNPYDGLTPYNGWLIYCDSNLDSNEE